MVSIQERVILPRVRYMLLRSLFFVGKHWIYRKAIQDKQKGQSEGKIQSGSSPSRTITQSPRGCEYETLYLIWI